MKDIQDREEIVFHQALELDPGQPRNDFLEKECGDDQELRQRVERLLAEYDSPVSLLDDQSTVGEGAGAHSGIQTMMGEQPGDLVGRYKLLQKIGEGGFGVVWMAEQLEPVSRRVALKVIKLGMDTKEVIARFEAERQALAMMDHPNIAKVLDAGATEQGRPFFVMELVNGIPITQLCDQQKLNLRARLELFVEVCGAVQHAHQKGVIHRDLKPSNVLVNLSGDRPIPKVIDFGIAKATQGKLTEKTLFTRIEQFVGTPAYMAPEQAAAVGRISGIDVDTRSDIYSLGVLLYELLTGSPPFDARTLVQAGYDRMREIIITEEPPKPSTRLGALSRAERTEVAETHGADPDHLPRIARGELDWIVMKAIEKDRARRYETANALALDVQRHLAGEPVLAAPQSKAYLLGKFVRRYKAGLATAAAVMLALVVGTTVALWGRAEAREAFVRKDEEARRADQEAQRANQLAREKGVALAVANNLLIQEQRMGKLEMKEGSFPMPREPGMTPNPGSDNPIVITYGENADESPLYVYDEFKWVLQPLRDRLESELRSELRKDIVVDLRIKTYNGYHALIDALANGEVDFIRGGAFAYLLAHDKNPRIQILARESPDRVGGRLFVRRELGIKSTKDLTREAEQRSGEGRPFRMAFAGTSSGSGRFRPQWILKSLGIDCDMIEWNYYGSHTKAAEAVLRGDADLGAIKASKFEEFFGPESDHKDMCIDIHTFEVNGKPWVASEQFCELEVDGKNLSEVVRDSLFKLPDDYAKFWPPLLDQDGENRLTPPSEFQFPLVPAVEGDYLPLLEKLRVGREFFNPVVKDLREERVLRELIDKTGKANEEADKILLEELGKLDTIDFDILVLRYRQQLPYNMIRKLLSAEVRELDRRHRNAMNKLKARFETAP